MTHDKGEKMRRHGGRKLEKREMSREKKGVGGAKL